MQDSLLPEAMWKWIVFLAAVAVAAVVIGVAGPPSEEKQIDPSASTKGKGQRDDAESTDAKVEGARIDLDFAKAVAASAEWQRGAERYVDRLLGERPESWTAPPAGRAVAPDIVAARAANTPAVRLRLTSISGDALASEKYTELELGSSDVMRSISLTDAKPIDVALAPASGAMWFRLYRVEGLFFRHVSESVQVPFQRLIAGGEIELTLRASASAQAPQARLVLQARALKSVGDGAQERMARAPIELRKGDLPNSYAYAGVLDGLSPGDDIVIDSDLRYTAVIVYGDRDLRGSVRGFRLDTGTQIGVYGKDIPLFGAVVNNRVPVMIRIDGAQTDPLSYHVLAVSGKKDPGADVVLWYLGGHLMGSNGDRLPLSNERARAVTSWLASAFGVRIGSSDLEKVSDPKLRGILQTLIGASTSADHDKEKR